MLDRNFPNQQATSSMKNVIGHIHLEENFPTQTLYTAEMNSRSNPSNITNSAPEKVLETNQSDTHQENKPPTDQHEHTETTTTDGPVNTDLWSAAYREAVESLGDDIDRAILKGSNAAQLFVELEKMDEGASKESAFARGVAYLRSIQVPLEKFKLALDLVSPVSSADPAASTIAISFATAGEEFAKQIGNMLDQMSYIDGCDTLGQRTESADIHKALVSVYREILEFYKVAHEILMRRGRKFAMGMILETDRLPNIVEEFVKQADMLRKLIEKATLEIVEDIKSMLYDREISRWLDNGKLKMQVQYHTRLQDIRTDEACKFLLTHSVFQSWYSASDKQCLAILGEMGCGKSVAMAFLVDELNRRSNYILPRPRICYYYCRDDESGQASYVLCGLISALLEQLTGLKKTFYNWYKDNQASGNLDATTSASKLQEFLESILPTLDRTLFILIDGLDECDRCSRKTLITLLSALSTRNSRLKVVFSSRPEESILEHLNQAVKINITSDAHRDSVIARHTVEKQLSYLPAEIKTLITGTLSDLARGSAIWTKMVVELIEVRRIRALGPMRRFLQHLPLPGQLSRLFLSLITRSSQNDPENKDIITASLKVLAVTCRPLSILELSSAVTLASSTQCDITSVAGLEEIVDRQRVMSLIHPFITRVDFEDINKRQVQLVHQSVREFITHNVARLPCSRPPEALNLLTDTESPELCILNICMKYLLLEEIGTTPLFSEEQLAIEELPQEFDLFSDNTTSDCHMYTVDCTWEAWEEDMIRYDPTQRGFGEFFVYAASYWLKHLGTIENGPLPSLDQIQRLCQAGSTRLDNWIRQHTRPDCVIKAREEFDSKLYDPLSIICLYGSDRIFREMLEITTLRTDCYLPSSAMDAADQIMQWGDLSRLRLLFGEGRFAHQLRDLEFFRLAIKRWHDLRSRHQNWEDIFGLVDSVLDALVEEQWGEALFSIAVRASCNPLVERLLDRAHDRPELKEELMRGLSA
ncbi:hypothetical protein N0V90_004243 [Kalmusia sp. IMI 367209]|nr:hypothetical protein N0V90_004243 [Kalmusia sp. IMI 367209]